MAYYKLGKNTNSHLLKHSTESEHKPLEVIYDQIIGTEQRKLFEALLIEELRPTFNKSMSVWENGATLYFSVSLKFGACYITD